MSASRISNFGSHTWEPASDASGQTSRQTSRVHLALPPGGAIERVPEPLLDLISILLAAGELHAQLGSALPSSSSFGRRPRLHAAVKHASFWSQDEIQSDLRLVWERSWGTRPQLELVPHAALHHIVWHREPRLAQPQRTGSLAPASQAPRVLACSPDLDSLAGVMRQLYPGDRSATRPPPGIVLVALDAMAPSSPRRSSARWPVQQLLGEHEVQLCTSLVASSARQVNALPAAPRDTWSLLHAVLAAAVSLSVGAHQVSFFENGVENLALPLTAAALASPAARPVDPEIAAALSRLLTRIAQRAFVFENPFVDRTPAEVITDLVAHAGEHALPALEAFHGAAWPDSDSGARVDSCLAILGALLGKPAYTDWCTRTLVPELLAPMHESLADAYMRAIRELPELPDGELALQLGITAAAPAADPGSNALGLDLCRRHARSVRRVLEAMLVRHAPALVAGTLPPGCLLVRATIPRHFPAEQPHGRQPTPTFRKRADRWELWFGHGEPIYLNESKGMAYLHRLLQHPGRMYSAAELRAHEAGMRAPLGSLGVMADREALLAYRTRLDDLRGQLETANDNNDLGLAQRAQEEIAALEAELGRCLNLVGRQREASDSERARKAVSNAIHRALQRIEAEHAQLGQHLAAALRIGITLCYAPRDAISWLT